MIIILLLFTLGISASYSLGPDTYALSDSQYDSMRYVWSNEQNQLSHCVIADTYSLLALEAISGKQIIGGGFPINSVFAQPEREVLLTEIKNNLKESNLDQAFKLTKSDRCWLMREAYDLADMDRTDKEKYMVFGDWAVAAFKQVKNQKSKVKNQ